MRSYIAKLRCNKLTLTEKLLSHSLSVDVACSAQDREASIDIFKSWIVFGGWGSSGILGQLAHHDQRVFEFELCVGLSVVGDFPMLIVVSIVVGTVVTKAANSALMV